MQKVTEAERALLDRYAKITLAVYLDGQRINAGVGSFELAAACGSEDAFSFGNACANGVNLSIDVAMPTIKDHSLRVTWSVMDAEHPLFDGKILNAVVSAGHTAIEAWDAMYFGGSNIFYPAAAMLQTIDAADAFTRVAASMGVAATSKGLQLLDGISIQNGMGHLPEETSNAAAAGYIAGLIGGNAIIDRNGQLDIVLSQFVDFESEPYSGGAGARNEDFFITGITLQRESIDVNYNEDGTTFEETTLLEFGAGDGTLVIPNPLADQDAADRCYEALKNVSFRPGNYSFPGGLLLEPGDIFKLHSMDGSYFVAAITLSMSFDGGIKTTAGCGGKMDAGGAQGAINQALAMLAADFARIRKLVAENAEIVSARITNLTVDDITAGRIHSTDFSEVILPMLHPVASQNGSAVVTRNGSVIVLPDAGRRELLSLTIFGKSTQIGTPTPSDPVPLAIAGERGSIPIKVGTSVADVNAQTLTVSTPNGLPGIKCVPRATIGGNYIDANGDEWLCDEIDFARGKYIRRVGIQVFDGSADEAWGNWAISGGKKYRVQTALVASAIRKPVDSYTYSNIASNMFTATLAGSPGIWAGTTGITVDPGGSIFCYTDLYNTSDVSLWTAFLAEHPMTVLYQLATPIETDLTAKELADFAALRTVGPGTIIYNADSVDMTLSYIIGGEDLLFPSAMLFPNTGEQITRGFEIDFSTGTIRGVFWSESAERMEHQINELTLQQTNLLQRIEALEKA